MTDLAGLLPLVAASRCVFWLLIMRPQRRRQQELRSDAVVARPWRRGDARRPGIFGTVARVEDDNVQRRDRPARRQGRSTGRRTARLGEPRSQPGRTGRRRPTTGRRRATDQRRPTPTTRTRGAEQWRASRPAPGARLIVFFAGRRRRCTACVALGGQLEAQARPGPPGRHPDHAEADRERQTPTPQNLEEARGIIDQRVNGTGVAEAEVTTQGDNNIVVEIPGEQPARPGRHRQADQAQLRFRAGRAAAAPAAAASPRRRAADRRRPARSPTARRRQARRRPRPKASAERQPQGPRPLVRPAGAADASKAKPSATPRRPARPPSRRARRPSAAPRVAVGRRRRPRAARRSTSR